MKFRQWGFVGGERISDPDNPSMGFTLFEIDYDADDPKAYRSLGPYMKTTTVYDDSQMANKKLTIHLIQHLDKIWNSFRGVVMTYDKTISFTMIISGLSLMWSIWGAILLWLIQRVSFGVRKLIWMIETKAY